MPIRWMSDNDAREFLCAGTEGRLATCNRAGEPYITPLNYLYREGKIYFHSKLTGRKLDNIAENSRVCFEVSTPVKIDVAHDRACGCSTRYTSVLVFGAAHVLSDEKEKAALLNLLTEKYAAGEAFQPVKEKDAAGCAVVEISIAQISGKMNVDPE
ncbi:MAG: pyridoxamine 5'-phosphate oxidase family protein [Terracidiphilus sp.]|jgi:nitroimidazol reductase NimA-like FMN-containing flavoprotein (pyridoxamine 5'-phosphate oxidase superfamily)